MNLKLVIGIILPLAALIIIIIMTNINSEDAIKEEIKLNSICGDGLCNGEDSVFNCPEDCEKCTDTDGGKDIYVKGNLDAVLNDGSKEQRKDSCFKINGRDHLAEWYCEKFIIRTYADIECPQGCFDGACLNNATCEPGWKCLDKNTKGYQNSSCIWSNTKNCGDKSCIGGGCK